MSTDKSITNRNADPRKKGGPTTEAGRRKSSANATRHGVLSNKAIVLQSESNEEFEDFKRKYYDSLNPVGFIESELVDEMILAKWRQRRTITCETATIDNQMDIEAEKLAAATIDIDDATRTAHAIQTLANESNDLALLSRYETRFHRMYHRALKQLLDLQDRRKRDGQTVETKAPAPSPQSENANLPNELPAPLPPAKTSETRGAERLTAPPPAPSQPCTKQKLWSIAA
jgi:hypothetical protein